MSLTKISIPSSVEIIEESAFYLCSSLTLVSLPFSMTSIEQSAFGECSSLTKIEFPYGLHTIEDHTFSSCISLREVIISSSVTSIGNYSFAYCSSLYQINIPSSVVSINDYAFASCSSLSNLTIPSSVDRIGSHAFANCISLSNLSIPSSIKKIENDAFEGCSNMETYFSDFNENEFTPFDCAFICIKFAFIISYSFLGIYLICVWIELYPWFKHGYKSGRKVYNLLETTWISVILTVVFFIVFSMIKKIFIKRTANIQQYRKRYIIFKFISFIIFLTLFLIINICTKMTSKIVSRKDVVDGKNIKCLKYIIEGVEGARDWVSKQSEKKQKDFEKWYSNLYQKAFLFDEATDYYCDWGKEILLLIAIPLAFYLFVMALALIIFLIPKCKH